MSLNEKDITLDWHVLEYLETGMIGDEWDERERRRVVHIGAHFEVSDGKLYVKPAGKFGRRWVPPIAERRLYLSTEHE